MGPVPLILPLCFGVFGHAVARTTSGVPVPGRLPSSHRAHTWESAGGPPPSAGTTGLYHVAIWMPCWPMHRAVPHCVDGQESNVTPVSRSVLGGVSDIVRGRRGPDEESGAGRQLRRLVSAIQTVGSRGCGIPTTIRRRVTLSSSKGLCRYFGDRLRFAV